MTCTFIYVHMATMSACAASSKHWRLIDYSISTKKLMNLPLFLQKVSNGAKSRNRYNQVPHLTQDTNGKVTNSQKTPQTRAKRSALSQQVTTKHI